MRAMLINMRGITLSQEKKTNRITVNATFDTGIHITLETDFNDKIVTWSDGGFVAGSVTITFSNPANDAMMGFLRILRGLDPNIKIIYQLGGYVLDPQIWFSYVMGREPHATEIP